MIKNWMHTFLILNVAIIVCIFDVYSQISDICGGINGKKFYLEFGESGSLIADYSNNVMNAIRNQMNLHNKCTIEFITCPSCIIEIKFRYLNISRSCGKASVFDTCGCDYVWIYEPPIEDASGEQFCGLFVSSNVSELSYVSRTKTIAIAFVYNNEYGHAFSVDYITKRNRITVEGYPRVGNMNNASQIISTPFFPYLYPTDLSVEYVITCISSESCRISFLFTDFLIDESSIVEFFDWNGQRMQVITGSIFRPPVIISNGPSLVVRFYANGGINYGFKATYSFILGGLDEYAYKPNIGCGGHVNNLGGGITMMNMVHEGTQLFDCVWIIKPPENFQHRKTHLYVKVATFLNFVLVPQCLSSTKVSPGKIFLSLPVGSSDRNKEKRKLWLQAINRNDLSEKTRGFVCEDHFEITVEISIRLSYNDHEIGMDFECFSAGTTELIVRQGLTSNQSSVEVLRHPNARHSSSKQQEHVVPISQGFYISLRGVFTPESRLAIVYAAFNYKDCYGGSDFLCLNLRCISILLYCDGFDHCGDDSDESSCFQDAKDHREISKVPNFLFPKMEVHTDITTATLVFLMCTFGLIVIIMAMALLLYRVTVRAHHHRHFQDHLDTIHAILEETVGDIEEEIIVPDEPPDYEPPPEYDELLRLKLKNFGNVKIIRGRCSECSMTKVNNDISREAVSEEHNAGDSRPVPCTSMNCQSTSTPSSNIPESPPPTYEKSENFSVQNMLFSSSKMTTESSTTENPRPGTSANDNAHPEISMTSEPVDGKTTRRFEILPKYSSQIFNDIKKGFRNCRSVNFLKNAKRFVSCSEEDFARCFSDSELMFNSNVDFEECRGIAARFRFKKSYSTDDLSLL